MMIHVEPINTPIASQHGRTRVDRNLSAVMLADGQWYPVEDPTLPDGPDGYLSFLQRPAVGESAIMVNVAMQDIKAVAYYGMPTARYQA